MKPTRSMPRDWFGGGRLPRLAGLLLLVITPVLTVASDKAPNAPRRIDFDATVRPILARHCYGCHGSQKRKGGLDLHLKTKALTGGDSGPLLEAGKGEDSLLIERISDPDPATRMPPPEAGAPLDRAQVAILRDWIDQGAPWPDDSAAAARKGSTHWSFRPPARSPLPRVRDSAWPRNPIDRWVLARLEAEGLRPSPEADRATLIRRLCLDLIGLPPTLAEIDAFVSDTRPDAYERLVDRLLASPQYGERWGRRWLDRARFADTNGYEKDRERSIWPYRDWVLRAHNRDMPFDRFTVAQIAGDLLPGATVDDRVATGFHRNTMINEEGGIDVEEFRYASLVDRVATTGTVWLGLTIQCAQCHTHKYDPITQREYYQFLAFLDNADEPDLDLPSPEIEAKRKRVEAKIAALAASLPDRFPAEDPNTARRWETLVPVRASAESGAPLEVRPDGSLLASGPAPIGDRYTLTFEPKVPRIAAIRVEALTDPSLPGTGPGRAPNGNFVLTEFRAGLAADGAESEEIPLKLGPPASGFSQKDFEIQAAVDGKPGTGWAIDDGSGRLNKDRSATFPIVDAPPLGPNSRLIVHLDHQYGGKHVLGRFRISVAAPEPVLDPDTLARKRSRYLRDRLAAWERRIAPVHWTPSRPTRVASRKRATMTVLDDDSILATGDKPNNDTYEVDLPIVGKGITAIRLEVLPDPSLPDGGPGRAPLFSVGDFILTELSATATTPAAGAGEPISRPVGLQNATEDYSEPGRPAALAIDGISDTGWTVKGGIGRPHAAVFEFRDDVGEVDGRATTLRLTLRQEGIHQMTLGRFRISTTRDRRPIRASGVPAEVEAILLRPPSLRTVAEEEKVLRQFLGQAPELAGPNAEIARLRASLPRFATTMVMRERSPEHARTTRIRKRGEFLKPTDPVTPEVPAVLHPLPDRAPRDRLALARWLVDPANPLVGRVVMNQVWQSYFGRGLVATVEDFGTRGERPTHPELLDWLACEFVDSGWSLKAMHRLIVGSATYRQDSRISEGLEARDPRNELLARGPRFRVEAEVVRDIALAASGLLVAKVGGPSVFPPQPEGVSSLAYGQTAWNASEGADRYRRGLYTFLKRTAPYAAFVMLDAPTSETTCVRRERSNTPLQALTLLNDAVFVECARALAVRVLAEAPPDDEGRVRHAYRLCLGRVPRPEELPPLLRFLDAQRDRFRPGGGGEDPARLLGPSAQASVAGTPADLAAWTALSRVLLNLDETITKE